MRKIFVAALTAIAILFAGLALATPAQAQVNPELGDWQFYTGSVCMADGAPEYNVTEAAQQWNLKVQAEPAGGDPTDLKFGITARNNCVTAGYPPSRRFTIDVQNLSGSGCVYFYNQQLDQYGRWTNNPYAIINTDCGYTTHYISMAIGYIMGLNRLNSSGYNSRVMNNTLFSVQNVPYPSTYDANAMAVQYFNPWGIE